MAYKFDMQDEKKKRGMNPILTEGWHNFTILEVEDTISKKGDPMFVWDLEENESKENFTLYTTAVHKKRWLLKQMLIACGLSAKDGESYTFDSLDIFLGKQIKGKIKNTTKEVEFMNREGNMIKKQETRSEITQIENEVPFG